LFLLFTGYTFFCFLALLLYSSPADKNIFSDTGKTKNLSLFRTENQIEKSVKTCKRILFAP